MVRDKLISRLCPAPACSQAQADLAGLLDEVICNREIVFIQLRGSADIAMLPAADLSGLQETIYLLRSPKNARRLLSALDCANRLEAFSESFSMHNDLKEGDP